ncbi:Histamine H1 receptor [Holothuria leucospilota]|uniref:Histamine H1 receptor n=1 Tax=Holothuria leucospilota TaxID=206669 RepID=A0A9Q0YNL5_HOLLE|nr:Histamine H1 receptor [Holothuria leucospilota]
MKSTDFPQIDFTTSSLLETSLSTLNASHNGTTEEPWVFDDINQRIVVAALLSVIAVFGITGNILTIVAVILSKKLQTIANVFVVNLTIAGGLSCATLPFTIANMIANADKSVIPDGLCTFVSLLSYCSFDGTIVSHALIAFDRYYGITKPHYKYYEMFTKCRITIFITCAWIYANISVIFVAISSKLHIMYNTKYRLCLPDIANTIVAKVSLFRAVTIDLFILIFVSTCYTAIFIYIYRHNKKLLGMFNVRKTIRTSLQKKFGFKTSSRKCSGSEQATQDNGSVNAPIILEGPLSEVGNASSSSDMGDGNSESNARNDENFSDLSVERRSSSQSHLVRELSHGVRFTDSYDVARTEKSRSLDKLSPSNSSGTNGGNKSAGRKNLADDVPSDELSGKTDDSNTENESTGKETTKDRIRHKNSEKSLPRDGTNLQTTLNARQVKITMNMFLVVAVYVVCIVPYVVCLIVDSFERLFPYVAIIFAMSNAINPAIYAWKHPYFRAVFKPMIQLKFSKIPNPSPILKFFIVNDSGRSRMH